MTKHQQAKDIISSWRAALYDFEVPKASRELAKIAPNAVFHICHPFGDYDNSDAYFDGVILPLSQAMPDCERRDHIVIAGDDEHGAQWVGCCGYFTGTFLSPLLDIPMTGQQAYVRFHEFYRIDNGEMTEMQAIYDITSLMMQAKAWPLSPSLGLEWNVPGPSSQDGLNVTGNDEEALKTRTHITQMLHYLQKHPKQPPEIMELERFWHEKMNWYGPSAIGTCRGVAGFRHWHQIPFLNAMPDRGQYDDQLRLHFFAQGQYAGFTGWPGMMQTMTHDGWLGIAPTDRRIVIRSLDFWRIENDKIRENWVLIDILDIYRQIGVDVFARLREFNKARNMNAVNFTKDY